MTCVRNKSAHRARAHPSQWQYRRGVLHSATIGPTYGKCHSVGWRGLAYGSISGFGSAVLASSGICHLPVMCPRCVRPGSSVRLVAWSVLPLVDNMVGTIRTYLSTSSYLKLPLLSSVAT
eukprot:scaffold248440_cov56-Cyclotella_meneghiniana.AAC.3